MKATVQNGATHGLSRRDMEALLPLLPAALSQSVKQIVLYQGSDALLKTAFYPKEQIVGIFWPVPAESLSKVEGLKELLVALSVIAHHGELPKRLSPARRKQHEESTAELLEQWTRSHCSNAL
ncbi:MAG: hypothetical protein Q4G39_09705 [Brachymonas sp.]|nr:hypothetical protein [Brachymonas sp.]